MDAKPRSPAVMLRFAVAGFCATVLLTVGILLKQRGYLLGFAKDRHIHSVAILPLQNLSVDPSHEYLADGLTEALVTDLAQVRSLRVISRTSIMTCKGTSKRLPETARVLNVDRLVEGSVIGPADYGP